MPRTAISENDYRAFASANPKAIRQAPIEYKTGLNIHIWKPNATNRPCILIVHGGGWVSRTDDPYVHVSEIFASLGFAVAYAEYTLDPANPQTPIDDILDAVQYLRTNAVTFNIDSTKIVILGASAGGHLGIMAGIQGTPGTNRPDLVIGWSPACDLVEAWNQGNNATLTGYLNVEYPGNEALYQQYSPKYQITENCCPLRIVGSDNEDTSVSGSGLALIQFTSMVTAAEAVGVYVESRIFSGSCHAIFTNRFPGFLGSNDIDASLRWINKMLGENSEIAGRLATTSRTATSARIAA